MRYLGIDYGSKYIGIAISDLTNTIASPLKMVLNNSDTLISQIREEVLENKITTVVLGFPKNMNNSIGESAQTVMVFKELLENELNIPVILQDERKTTALAHNYMIEANISRKKRKKHVDGLAAAIILQIYLDRKKGEENGK